MNFQILKSYCKLNLFLTVNNLDKKKNLHNIETYVSKISIFDNIKIKKIKKNENIIKFSGFFSKNIKKNNNSINKSLVLLKKHGFIKPEYFYDIRVNKKIPVFSGLGGGSSNAAEVVKYFTKGKKISKKNLSIFSKSLGSDFKLFFYSNCLYQKNLNIIQKQKQKNIFYFLVIFPYFKCSSKDIYSKFKKKINTRKNLKFKYNSKKNLINILKFKNNDLERIVKKKYPQINKILYELKKINSCEFARMTGSGSACFGLFLTKKSANIALKKIKKQFPKYWCVVGKTI